MIRALDRQLPWGWVSVRVLLAGAAGMLLLIIATVPPIWTAIAFGAVLSLAISLRYPEIGLGLIGFAVPWVGGASLPVAGFPISLTDVLVAGVTAAWLARSVRTRRHPIATRIWLPFVVTFLAAIALSTTESVDMHASLREIVKWTEMAALFLAGAFFLQRRAQVQRLLVVLVLAGISQAILGYVQFAFALGPQAFAAQRLFLRAYGTFDQPNPYAGYLNMMLPLALGLAIAPRHGRPTRIWWSATVVILGAVLASESRGALLATVAALLVVVPLRYREVRVPLLAGAVAAATAGWLAALGLVPLGPAARLLSAVGLGSVDFSHVTDANFSAVERAAHWLAGVRMFAAHPILGVGIGNYAAVYGAYHPRGWYAALEHAHNYYINIAAEAGVVGLIAYVLLAGSALWYSYAAIRRVQDPVYRAAVLGVMGALVATSFHNLFDVLYVHGMAALLGILMALVACSLRATPEGALGEQQSSAIESIRFTDVRGRVNKSMYSRDLR